MGIPGNFAVPAIPAALVISHVFAAQIVTCVALPMFVAHQSIQQFGLAHWTYKLLFFHSLKVSSTLFFKREAKVKIEAFFFFFECAIFCDLATP